MVRTRVAIAASIAWIMVASVVARAQDTESAPPETPRFESEVVVTPERGETPRNLVPASTVVLEGSSLPALPGAQLSEVVSFLPGVQFQQAQPYSPAPLVSARGFFGGGEAEYVLLLVDGVPVMDAESGLIDWATVPTSSIRRIEVFRGPGASLYGDSAIGGVVQILTNRPARGGALTFSGGSFGTLVADGSFGRRSSSSSLGVVVTGSALRTDGAFAHSNANRFVLGGGVDGRIRAVLWRWTVNGNNRDADGGGVRSVEALQRDPSAFDPLFRFDNLSRKGLTTAFTVEAADGGWQHRARIYTTLRNEDLVRTILLAPGLGDHGARRLSTSVIGGSIESARAFSAVSSSATLRLGLDSSHEDLTTAYRAVANTGALGPQVGETSGVRLRTGVFTSSAWEPASRLRLAAGLRWDRIADHFGAAVAGPQAHQAWSPRIGATVFLNDAGSATMFAQASRAFKVPTLDQLFDSRPFPDFRGGAFTISNPRLVPQRATNLEAGVAGGSGFRWSVLAYRMMVDDEIDFDVRTFSYSNIGRSRHTGLEIESGTTAWGRVQPSVTYALIDVTAPGENRQLKNVPRHVVTATAGVDLPWSLAAHIRYRRTTGAFLDDENAHHIDGPSTIDLRVRRLVGRHTVFLDMLNLTDNQFQEYGFTLSDFRGQSVPYVYPGAPRAMRAGIIASF